MKYSKKAQQADNKEEDLKEDVHEAWKRAVFRTY
jgi:hypothetical protein